MLRRIGAQRIVGAAAVGIVISVGGWVASDAVEQDNDFCTSCHIDGDVRLHFDLRRNFDGRPPMNLSALHGMSPVEARPEDSAFRCIDCHGGVGLIGRAKVKMLAAKDAAVWLAGLGHEPDDMNHPLEDADCKQCHESFRAQSGEFEQPTFHELAVHNNEFGQDCVECHSAHRAGGDASYYFLEPAHVRAKCAHCHTEFEN